MPEITSVETIRDKMREFDQRVDGAITAAKTLARIKTDAEQLLNDMQGISAKSEQSLQKAEAIRFKLQELQLEWHALRQKLEKSEAESKETRELLLSEPDSAIQSLGKKVADAEDRLKTANKISLAEQADLLRRLDTSTRAHAEVAAKAQSTAAETVARLDGVLATLRDDLHAEIHTKLTNAEGLLESEAQRVETYLEGEQKTLRESVQRQAGNHERLLRDEMTAFKEEMKQNLTEHQQAIDRQLTGFLNKQNALIQNLSQQIDSFSRVSQAQSADLATTNSKIGELRSTFNSHMAVATDELAALATRTNGLNSLLGEVQTGLHSQGEFASSLHRSLQETTEQLNQTIEKLRHLPLVGGKFK